MNETESRVAVEGPPNADRPARPYPIAQESGAECAHRDRPGRSRLPRLYLRVLALLRPEGGLAAALVLANAALAGAQFIEPMLFGRIVDRLTGPEPAGRAAGWADVLPLLAGWGGLGLFTICCSVALAFHADRLSHRRRLQLMADFFDHVLRLPSSFHTNTHSGRLLKIMLEGANGISSLWLSFLRENCASVVGLAVTLPLSLTVNWRLGAMLVGLVGLAAVVTTIVVRKTEALQRGVEQHHSGFAERVADSLSNVAVIQSFARVETELGGLGRIIDALLRAQMPVLSWWAVAAVATRAFATLTLLGIFVGGLALHFKGLATTGEIVAFVSFATLMIARLELVVGFLNALFLQAPKLADFFDVLDTAPSVQDEPGARDPGRLVGHVAFEGVGFSYDGLREAVSDIGFSVEAGQTVALVGQTGSGKSTTLGLLHRVFDPSRGRVTIDGHDLKAITLGAVRNAVGVVFQDPMLFARSIEDNLRIGKPDASAADIDSALERAQASAFVGRLPQGLSTILGEQGRSLSGGERQRLAIARVLLKDPPILLLDEATSALDAVTERAVQAAIEAATKGRTTFIIAHRLATVRHADRVLVFHQGRIVEDGRFEDLLGQGGRFAALAEAQGIAGVPGSAAPGRRTW